MAELKTRPNDQDVVRFLNDIPEESRRRDCFTLVALMQEVTQAEARMWGSSIVGFGSYHYTYATGRSGESFLTGFSPRKQHLTLYIIAGFDQHEELLAGLGKHTVGKSCLYIKRLADVDLGTLKELVRQSVDHMVKSNA